MSIVRRNPGNEPHTRLWTEWWRRAPGHWRSRSSSGTWTLVKTRDGLWGLMRGDHDNVTYGDPDGWIGIASGDRHIVKTYGGSSRPPLKRISQDILREQEHLERGEFPIDE